MPHLQFATVIFDLDGTLLDTLDDLTASVNFALETWELPTRSRQEVRRFVGSGLERLMELSVPGGTANQCFQECADTFVSHYSQNMWTSTRPYGGIVQVLRTLKAAGVSIAVVSNKFDWAVKELCQSYFDGHIDIAIGQSGDTPMKPSPVGVLQALRVTGTTPDRALYVGDSDIDIRTARNAGVESVGVTWGFGGREALEREGAAHIVDAPSEILPLLGLSKQVVRTRL